MTADPQPPTEIAQALTRSDEGRDCNELTNGRCDTRACFIRGGWKRGPTVGFTPRCHAKDCQDAAALIRMTQEDAA